MSIKRKMIAGCLLAAVLMLCCMPLKSAAEEGQEEMITFSSFEELRELCSRNADSAEVLLVCLTEDPIAISEDLTIPSGAVVSFDQFTVAEGVTLTVMENAEIQTYALRIEGELCNYGSVIQQNWLSDEGSPDFPVEAWIPGHITNKGTMLLTNVYGKRNISSIFGKLTMMETENKKEEPTPEISAPPKQTEIEATPAPGGSDGNSIFGRVIRQIRETMDLLQEDLPWESFAVVLVILFAVLRSNKSKAKKRTPQQSTLRQTRGPEPSSQRSDYSGEDHFQRDQRTRVAQLDEWLQNGLIDRKEYRVLKQKYEKEN